MIIIMIIIILSAPPKSGFLSPLSFSLFLSFFLHHAVAVLDILPHSHSFIEHSLVAFIRSIRQLHTLFTALVGSPHYHTITLSKRITHKIFPITKIPASISIHLLDPQSFHKSVQLEHILPWQS